MDKDIQSQIQRAKELLQELKNSCQSDLKSKVISEKTKNLTQEVLTKMRHVLDQSMGRFFEKIVTSTLSVKEAEKARKRVYFPLAKDHASLKSTLGQGQMTNLETLHPAVYNFLTSVQPYNQNYQWLEDFSKFSNEKHLRLTPQELKEENETVLGTSKMGVIRVGRGGSVKMANCLISGIPVNVGDINTAALSEFDPRLRVQRTTWVSFNFQGTSINILDLCGKAVNELEKLLEDFFKKF